MPDATPATQGPPSVLLEVVDGAAHVEHNYTKSVEEARGSRSSDWERVAGEKTDEASSPLTGKEVFIKEDSVEAVIAFSDDRLQESGDLFYRSSARALSHLEKVCSHWDTDSNCEYKWCPPSDMLSALYDGSFLDMDACELFPQLKPM